MPNIRQFDAPPNLGLNPSETGVDATAKAAQRIGMFYNQFGNATSELGNEKGQMWRTLGADAGSDIKTAGDVAVKYMDHEQVSQGSAAFAQLTNDLTNKYNAALKNADPNDPSFVAKFNEGVVQPSLDNFKSAFSTENAQAWAEAHANELQNHFITKGAADLSGMAKEAIKVNYEKTVNSLSSAAANDPSSLDFALAQVDHSVKAMADSSPTLSGADAFAVKSEWGQKAKEAIVKSAISGMIQKNPNVNLDDIQKKYGDFIKGDEMKMFQKSAQVQAKANALVEKQSAQLDKQKADLQVHQSAAKVITDNVTFDPQTGAPIVDPKFFSQALDIARKNPNASNAGETVRAMMSWGESQQAKGAKPADDPTVKADLTTRMFSPDNPTTTIDLMKARADGKISDHTFQTYHGLVQELEQSPLKGPIWQDTVAAVKGELILSGVGLPGKDITGEGNYAKWAQTFIPQYQAMSRAGTLPPNALDVKDPDSMISKSMAPFKRSIQQRTQDYLSTLGGGESKPGPAIAPPTKVTSPSDAAKLAPGTRYQTPDGKVYVR
jgi:hypothetical protein